MIALYKEDYIEVGYIRKGHGYKGHARIVVHEGLERDLLEQKFLFFEIDGCKIPFYIEEKLEQKDLILKFEFIDTVEELMIYQKSPLFMLTQDIKYADEEVQQNTRLSELAGMNIYDVHAGDLGPIIRIDEYPQQNMAVIMNQDKEILIPLHPSLIVEINYKDKIIKMDLPEGLV